LLCWVLGDQIHQCLSIGRDGLSQRDVGLLGSQGLIARLHGVLLSHLGLLLSHHGLLLGLLLLRGHVLLLDLTLLIDLLNLLLGHVSAFRSVCSCSLSLFRLLPEELELIGLLLCAEELIQRSGTYAILHRDRRSLSVLHRLGSGSLQLPEVSTWCKGQRLA